MEGVLASPAALAGGKEARTENDLPVTLALSYLTGDWCARPRYECRKISKEDQTDRALLSLGCKSTRCRHLFLSFIALTSR